MHTYPGITPFNVWDIELEVINDLIEAAQPKD
jgi:hypothetical protein